MMKIWCFFYSHSTQEMTKFVRKLKGQLSPIITFSSSQHNDDLSTFISLEKNYWRRGAMGYYEGLVLQTRKKRIEFLHRRLYNCLDHLDFHAEAAGIDAILWLLICSAIEPRRPKVGVRPHAQGLRVHGGGRGE